eukprot:11186177-Ditylum_brightwellii.AAC.1
MEVDNQITQTLNHIIYENIQINSAIDLVENESTGNVEETMNLDGMFEEQDSIDIADNLFILNKEEGRAAVIIYFEKYKDASLGDILSQVGHWQNKWTLIIAHAKDVENKNNETEVGENVEKDEIEGLLSKLMKASKEIDK